ncbi:MAG: hypothetical protein WD795_12235 [Woeseia sp.]
MSAPAVFALVLLGSNPGWAQENRFDLGVRGVVIIGDGQPANDMMGYGVVGRWEFRDSWHVGLAFDLVEFDYETPNRALGIESVEVVDPGNEFSRISLLVERHYGPADSPWLWFWTAGAGFASIDVGENAVGTTPTGGTYNIATTADDEAHFMVGGGLRRSFGENWALDAALTIQHHTTDYQLVDLVSGATGSIGSQTPFGLTLGISYAF